MNTLECDYKPAELV